MNTIDEVYLSRELNSAQLEAALQVEGPQLILAGAGSGKTRTITHKIAHLISEGVRPWNILAVTFTNKAAKEMKQRIRKLTGEDVAMEWMGTFHGICVRLLRRSLPAEGNSLTRSFSIFDDADQKRLVKNLLTARGEEANAQLVKKILGVISHWKNAGVDPDAAAEDAYSPEKRLAASFYVLYREALRGLNALDFDDLLLEAVKLLDREQKTRDEYRHRFRHVLVDEYQDTNKVQYRLIRLLTAQPPNITVVGDDDQSIYGWRGADVSIIRSFRKDYPNAHLVKLEKNYRSTANIVKAAASVIKKNVRHGDMVKKLYAGDEAGELVQKVSLRDDEAEARYVAECIQSRHTESLGEYAVFYRTNAQSRKLEEVLNREGIPCIVVGGTRFYQRREIKDLVAYLKVLANPRDSISLERIVNVPRRGIGKTTLDRLKAGASSSGISLWDALRGCTKILGEGGAARKVFAFYTMMDEIRSGMDDEALPLLLEKVVERSGFRKALAEEKGDEAAERLANVEELFNAVVEYDENYPESSLDQYLQEASLLTDADGKSDSGEAVRLMTLHSAKGLEFHTVFLAGCDEGLLPLLRDKGDQELEEERRLFYVGATRACRKLHLCSSMYRKIHGRDERYTPSRFLGEMDDSVCETLDRLPDYLKSDFFTRRPEALSLTPSPSAYTRRPSYAPRMTSTSSGKWPRARLKKAPKQREEVFPNYEEQSQENVYLATGVKIRHSRFGLGKVLSCSGHGEDARIEIAFQNGERRKLLLKYAKIEILK